MEKFRCIYVNFEADQERRNEREIKAFNLNTLLELFYSNIIKNLSKNREYLRKEGNRLYMFMILHDN